MYTAEIRAPPGFYGTGKVPGTHTHGIKRSHSAYIDMKLTGLHPFENSANVWRSLQQLQRKANKIYIIRDCCCIVE